MPDHKREQMAAIDREALWLLLGGGLDDAGKEKWLQMRLDEGMSAEAIFADATALEWA